ncbi:MAG: tyrosine-type recombinase/integrase [Proteobacteria bacterium]|nr:tyrosine-type recombinase/integrase [Pseudomonadota bacterium]
MSKLTVAQLRQTKPKNLPYKLPDGHGMHLYVATSGLMTWRYRYRIAGKESTFTLGEYPQMSLGHARMARMEAREMVRAGKNPALVRREEIQHEIVKQLASKDAKENSFKNVALEWIEQQRERWSKDHAEAVLNTLRFDAFPGIGDQSVDTITPPQVLNILRKIEDRGSLEIARKVLQRMNAVFRYAVQTGKATYNPAADMQGVLKTRRVQHRAAISSDDLPQFLRDLSSGDIHTTTKLALQFTVLTAARSGETRGATWDEIDIEAKLWKIPAKRMKMDSPHTVPLSKQAVAILERVGRLYGKEGLVFPGIRDHSKQLSENTMLYALYRLGYHSRATVHGFRATFSTIANESGFSGDVIEKALAHEERNKVRAAYHRSEYIEQRRELMQWWADLLLQMEHGAEIVPIRSAALK